MTEPAPRPLLGTLPVLGEPGYRPPGAAPPPAPAADWTFSGAPAAPIAPQPAAPRTTPLTAQPEGWTFSGGVGPVPPPPTPAAPPPMEPHNAWWYRTQLPRVPLTDAQVIETRRQIDPEGYRLWETSTPEQRSAYQPRPMTMGPGLTRIEAALQGPANFAREAFQTVTFNFGDEIVGLLGGDRDLYNARIEANRFLNPTGATLAQLVGSLPLAALPVAGSVSRVTLPGRIAAGAAVAGTEGFLYGAGAADGGVGERIQAGLRTAIPTALVGGALPIAAPAIARAASAAYGARHPIATAVSFVRSFGQSANEVIRDAANRVATQLSGQLASPALRREAAEMAAEGTRAYVNRFRAEADRQYATAEMLNPWITDEGADFFRASILAHVNERNLVIDPVLHPSARTAIGYLDELAPVVGQGYTLQDMETIRRRMVVLGQGRDGTDGAALGIVRDAFDYAIADLIDWELFHGDPAGVASLLAGREAASRYLRITRPREGDDARHVLNSMLAMNAEPGEVANWMFGSVAINPPGRAVRVMSELRGILGTDSAEWGAVRAAAFTNLVTPTNDMGGLLRPSQIADNITGFVNGRGTGLANVLFSEEERNLIAQFGNTMRLMQNDPAGLTRRLTTLGTAIAGFLGHGIAGTPGAIAAIVAPMITRQARQAVGVRRLLYPEISQPLFQDPTAAGRVMNYLLQPLNVLVTPRITAEEPAFIPFAMPAN